MTHFYFYKGEKDTFFVSNPKSINVKESTMKFMNSDMKLEEVGYKNLIDTVIIDDFNDLSKNIKHLVKKYGMRRFILEEKTPKTLRHRISFVLLGNSFWTNVLSEKKAKHKKKELLEPPLLWEIKDIESFDEGLKYFKINDLEIPQEIRSIMI